MTRHPRTVRSAALLVPALLLLAPLAACSASSDSASDAGYVEPATSYEEAAEDGGGGDAGATSDRVGRAGAEDAAAPRAGRALDDVTVGERSLVKRGTVDLSSDDVATTRHDVQRVADAYGGEVAGQSTETDLDGVETYARMVLRVPVDTFDDALADLERTAQLRSSSSKVEDVTSEVIDTDVRVATQRRSIRRISTLLDQAKDLADVVSIERELGDREATLGSLLQRQKQLRDTTTMSTLVVSVSLPAGEQEPEKEEATGFVAGLSSGWDAFTATATAVLTATGALLPFALLALVVGVPARVLWRRRRVAAPTTPPAPPVAG